jgi:hypothetical protein
MNAAGPYEACNCVADNGVVPSSGGRHVMISPPVFQIMFVFAGMSPDIQTNRAMPWRTDRPKQKHKHEHKHK